MAGDGKARHVDADLRHDDLGDEVTDARHGRQQAGTLADRRQGFSHSGVHLAQRPLEVGDEIQMQFEHQAVMCGDPATQSFDQLGPFVPCGSSRQISQQRGVALTCDDRSQHCSAGDGTSDSTLPSLMLASSSTFWMRSEC